MDHYFVTNKFLPKHTRKKLSLENTNIVPVLNSLCRIQKIAQTPLINSNETPLPEKNTRTSLNKFRDKLTNISQNKRTNSNFSFVDGKLVFNPAKAEVLNEYMEFSKSKFQNDEHFSTFMKKYFSFVPKQKNLIKNDKPNYLTQNKSIKPNQLAILETRNKSICYSILKNKSVLRSSFNNSKLKNVMISSQTKENVKKLNSLLSIQRETLKTPLPIEKNAMPCSFGDFDFKKTEKAYFPPPQKPSLKEKSKSQNFKFIFAEDTKNQTSQKKNQNNFFFQDSPIGFGNQLVNTLNINDSFDREADKDEDLEYYLKNNFHNK